MKFSIAILLLFVSLAVAEDFYVEAANYLDKCYKEIGLTDAHEGPLSIRLNKCGLACMFKAFKLLNENGSINVDEVLKHSKTLSREKLNEYVQICEKQGGYNAQSPDYTCEIAACFQKNDFFSDLD